MVGKLSSVTKSVVTCTDFKLLANAVAGSSSPTKPINLALPPNAATFNSILSDIPHYRNFAKGLGCLLNDKLNEIRKNASVAA